MSNTLKEQALLERISEIVAQYENRIADLRVAITGQQSDLTEKQNRIKELEARVALFEEEHRDVQPPEDGIEENPAG